MALAKPATLALCLWTTTLVLTTAASAQALPLVERVSGETCTDGGSFWSGQGSSGPVSIETSSDGSERTVAKEASVISSPGTVTETRTEILRRLPVMPVEDVQWCVEPNDPRCSPDPASAPAGHLAHAGDAAHATRTAKIAAAPLSVLPWPNQSTNCHAPGALTAIERPPQPR